MNTKTNNQMGRRVIGKIIFGAISGAALGVIFGWIYQEIIGWPNAIVISTISGAVYFVVLAVVTTVYEARKTDRRAMAILGAVQGGTYGIGIGIGAAFIAPFKGMFWLMLITTAILATLGAILGAIWTVRRMKEWQEVMAREPELRELFHCLGDGVKYNSTARKAAFRSHESVQAFRQAAPNWHVKCTPKRG